MINSLNIVYLRIPILFLYLFRLFVPSFSLRSKAFHCYPGYFGTTLLELRYWNYVVRTALLKISQRPSQRKLPSLLATFVKDPRNASCPRKALVDM